MATKPKDAVPPDVTPTKEEATAAAIAEARDTAVEIEFQGETYEITFEAMTSLDFIEAVEDDKPIAMMRAALGATQWRQFKGRHPAATDFGAFIDSFGKKAGTGNS